MPTWRHARLEDDEAIVAMSLALYAADPQRVSAAQVRTTLETFRTDPLRGHTIVLDADGECAGYAFLVSFWSNELGGEICKIDELYVAPPWRSRGCGTMLIESLRTGADVWPRRLVALELEVSPENRRAFALYDRLGFRPKWNSTLRLFVR